jgi:hypothetical protein
MALFFFANYQVLWNQAVRDIATTHQLGVDDSARFFALVNVAMGDAVDTALGTKVRLVSWRPLTAVQKGRQRRQPGNRRRPGLAATDQQPQLPHRVHRNHG